MAKRNNTPENDTVTREALLEELARARAELARVQAASAKALTIKVSAKGAVSVYGLGRFPTTLYAGQWRRLLSAVPAIEKFLTDHAEELKEK